MKTKPKSDTNKQKEVTAQSFKRIAKAHAMNEADQLDIEERIARFVPSLCAKLVRSIYAPNTTV